MFAGSSPLIGTGAISFFDPGWAEFHAHPVRLELAAHDARGDPVFAPRETGHRALSQISAPAGEDLRIGEVVDHRFRDDKRFGHLFTPWLHNDTPIPWFTIPRKVSFPNGQTL